MLITCDGGIGIGIARLYYAYSEVRVIDVAWVIAECVLKYTNDIDANASMISRSSCHEIHLPINILVLRIMAIALQLTPLIYTHIL
jgi:hypothetical protein